jgi:hypothetical protein
MENRKTQERSMSTSGFGPKRCGTKLTLEIFGEFLVALR